MIVLTSQTRYIKLILLSNIDEISNIIILIKNKYPNNLMKQKEESQKELSERGYNSDIIREWIGYLEE